MELNGYRLLLPEGTLDYFDLVDVKESVNEVVFYLEEKNIVPEKYTDQDTESKGFYDPVIVQDFPLRGKKVFLNIRRLWLLKKHNESISRNSREYGCLWESCRQRPHRQRTQCAGKWNCTLLLHW